MLRRNGPVIKPWSLYSNAMKALEYKNDFDALDRGGFVVVHPCSTF